MARRMRRRASSRGSSRTWRQNTWGFTPIGDLNQFDVFACFEQNATGTQVFYPILVDDMFNADANNAPFQQERIVCIRHMGDVRIRHAAGAVFEQMPPLVRYVVARLDEEAVADITYQFPSLFSLDFHLNERVLLSGHAEFDGQHHEPLNDGVRRWEKIVWDQKLPIRLETGETLWLVLETGPCQEDRPLPVATEGSYFVSGYTRALWRT